MFERSLKKAFVFFLSETRTISPHQHGFLPRQSCLPNLLIDDAVMLAMDDGRTVIVIYID